MTSRPRPKARIAIDLDNPYARLGVSPLASTEEIKRAAGDLRAQSMVKIRSEGQGSAPDDEAKILEIQRIEEQIATPAARAAYDREHPQNVLLTVQSGPRDRGFGPTGASVMVTAWLLEQLGHDSALVHADALWLWLPAGLDPDLLRELERFRRERVEGPPADDPRECILNLEGSNHG